jgi:hypothetical protein
MNFREAYKKENDMLKPDPDFVDGLISNLQRTRHKHKRRHILKFTTVGLSCAAAVCLVVIGAFFLFNENGLDGMSSLDSNEVLHQEERQDNETADDGGYTYRSERRAHRLEDQDDMNNDADYASDNYAFEGDSDYADDIGVPREDIDSASALGPFDEIHRYSSASGEKYSLHGHEFTFPEPLSEAMYRVIMEILALIYESTQETDIYD